MSEHGRRLEGKVALVTGASRGIGKAAAVELGAEGATVYITARSFDAPTGQSAGTARQTAADVTAAGGHGVAIQCDHADDTQVQAVIDRIASDHDGLDVLVNNVFPSPDTVAALGPGYGGSPFWETSAASWDALFTIAVRGHYIATQKAMPLLLKRSGLIVNISSPGAVCYFMSPLYGAGKAAGIRLMQDIAIELEGYPVSIVSIWPGIVRTEFTGPMFDHAPETITALLRDGWVNFPTADEDLAALTPEEILALTETPAHAGRAVAALAADANIVVKSGKVLAVSTLADEYGFTDIDGRSPDAFRLREAAAWPQLG